MDITKKLKRIGIIEKEELNITEKNFLIKAIITRLTQNVKEFSNSYNELYMKLYNCNMRFASIKAQYGNTVYFYENNTIYIDENWKAKKEIDVQMIHEFLHYLQNFKKLNNQNSEQRIGICNFSEFKIYGLGLNEAITQYIALRAIGEKARIVEDETVSIYTITNGYYPYLTSLAIQLIFLVGETNLLNGLIYGTEEFENDMYNTFEETTNKILKHFDKILNENNKTRRNYEKIKTLYFETQKIMYTTYWNKICPKIDTIDEVNKYTEKLHEYKSIVGKRKNVEDYQFISFTDKIESELNRKYFAIYKREAKKQSLIVYNRRISRLFRKVASIFGI